MGTVFSAPMGGCNQEVAKAAAGGATAKLVAPQRDGLLLSPLLPSFGGTSIEDLGV